jgi:hypothetical protein
VAELVEPGVNSRVRKHLIKNAVDFREMYGRKDLGKTADGRTAWDILSGPVDALLEGKAITFHRYELPPGHPMAPPHGGHPNDSLELGEDNVIRPVPAIRPEPVRRSVGD